MRFNYLILIAASSVWLVIEFLLILRDKSQLKGTTKIDRMTRNFNIISSGIAVLSPAAGLIFRNIRFFYNSFPDIYVWTGSALVISGLCLRYWAVLTLGKYFRTTVELEKDQKVIQKGPYRLIRHPSYSGMILFFFGYGLVSQNWFSFITASVLPTAALLYRINIEEKAFIREIGDEYKQYQSRTKRLVPWIW